MPIVDGIIHPNVLMRVRMDHCVFCGRLVDFCGPLNKMNECEDCESERLDNEVEDDDLPIDLMVARYNKSYERMSKM
jgi:hypothetical protein